jgi:hypothetical protein
MFDYIYRGEQLPATLLGRAAVQTLPSGGSDVAVEVSRQRNTGITPNLATGLLLLEVRLPDGVVLQFRRIEVANHAGNAVCTKIGTYQCLPSLSMKRPP